MNDITTSSHKTGKGNLNVLLLHKSYILVINSFTATKSELKIRLQLYSNADIVNPCLSIHELCHNPKSVFSQSIKWFPTNSGPRKRLKSNTTPHFQPYHYFLEFFNNPYLDKDLLSGTYQFHVCSDTFRECFENSSDRDTINCEPPALSMAIFEISPDSKSFRIVLDDAYYVPFGIGFWSQPLTLEQARYRFVLPKMEKDFSKGTFSIMNV